MAQDQKRGIREQGITKKRDYGTGEGQKGDFKPYTIHIHTGHSWEYPPLPLRT